MAAARKTVGAEVGAEVVTTESTGKIYVVETPVPGFCGIGAAGVQFAYGKAELKEGWVLEWFKEHGYKVTEKK